MRVIVSQITGSSIVAQTLVDSAQQKKGYFTALYNCPSGRETTGGFLSQRASNAVRFHAVHQSHYNDIIMSAMASQITRLTIVYSTVYSRRRSKKASKLRVIGRCDGNSPVTGEFPAQKVSNAEMFPFDNVIMLSSGTTWMFSVW